MPNTLTVPEITADVFRGFRTRVPAINLFGRELTSKTARKGSTLIAKIQGTPAVADYDEDNGGYKNGVNNAIGLRVDVPVTIDRHRHVTVKLSHAAAIQSNQGLWDAGIGGMGHALGKDIFDYAMGKVTVDNFSGYIEEAVENSDYETLSRTRIKLNQQKADGGRFAIFNSLAAGQMHLDPRIQSKEFLGQDLGAEPYLHYKNIAGFSDILEYPDLPTVGGMIGFAGDPRSIVYATYIPELDEAIDLSGLKVNKLSVSEVVKDPESGMSFLQIVWQEVGTFNWYVTYTFLYGVSVGKQTAGAAAGSITDKAGVIIKLPA